MVSIVMPSADDAELVPCENCGQPTTGRFCAFCRARAQILGERLGGAPSVSEAEQVVEGSEDREVARELAEEVLPVEIYGNAAAEV